MNVHVEPQGDQWVVKGPSGKVLGGPFAERWRANQKVRHLGMKEDPKIDTKPRKCMACPTMFDSEGPHHRLCDTHRKQSQPVAL